MKKIASGVIFIPPAYINYEWSLNYVPTSHSIVPKSLSIEKGLLLIQHFTHHQFDSDWLCDDGEDSDSDSDDGDAPGSDSDDVLCCKCFR